MGRKWTEQAIIARIDAISERGGDLSYTGLAEAGLAGMYAAAREAFGSWRAGIQAAGLPPHVASRRERWSNAKVLNRIKALHKQHGCLSSQTGVSCDRRLWNAANRRFGSWRDAVTRAGFDYDDFLHSWANDAYHGVAFEGFVEGVLDAAGVRHERHPRFEHPGDDRHWVIPDFVISEGVWWDAKLNPHSPHVDACVQRYLLHADWLTIVHLVGRRESEDRVTFLPAAELLDQLRDDIEDEHFVQLQQALVNLEAKKPNRTQLDHWASRWTRQAVLDAIVELAEQGVSLAAKSVREVQPRLYAAVHSKNCFDGWYNAVALAGFDAEAIERQAHQEGGEARRIYSEAYLRERIGELQGADADLSQVGLRERNPGLLGAICRQWGSVSGALNAMGIDPDDHRRQQAWSADLVRDRLAELADVEGRLLLRHVVEDANLYQAVRRFFSDVEEAARSAGLELYRHPWVGGERPWLAPDGTFVRRGLEEAVLARHREGLEMSCVAVLRDDPRLLAAVRQHTGGWYELLREIKLPVDAIRAETNERRRKWSQESIVDELKHLHAAGADLSVTGMRAEGRLRVMAIADLRFGKYTHALEAAGIDPESVRRPRRRFSRWTPERIVTEVRALHAAEADLSVTGMLEAHPRLYASACITHFGSWAATLQAAGIDPESVQRRYYHWPEPRILEELAAFQQAYPDASPGDLRRDHTNLYEAARRRFGSVDAACDRAGLPRLQRRTQSWSRQRILDEIRALHAAREPMWDAAVRTAHGRLHSRATSRDFFGSWQSAVAAAGLDYDAILAAKQAAFEPRWTQDRIKEAIRERVRNGQSLAPSKVKKDDGALLVAAVKKSGFGGWHQAVEAAGFVYADFVKARRSRGKT